MHPFAEAGRKELDPIVEALDAIEPAALPPPPPAVVVAPHPRAKRCSADAARVLAEAAVAAGAPDGIVQVVEEPSIPLVQALMADERTDVIVATGGTGVVRAAYSSGNPALGVGPGNVPVFVDASADINAAAGDREKNSGPGLTTNRA